MPSRIIVALDGMTWPKATELASRLNGKVWGFKCNDLLFSGAYWSPQLSKYGKIMFDPKLYDIPVTIENFLKRFVAMGADLVTVHASSGPAGLEAAVGAVKSTKTKILAVTALTSFPDDHLHAVYSCDRPTLVANLAKLALNAHCHGLVCAYPDLSLVKDWPILKVCPGFRRPADDKHDQVHIGTGEGADLVVVGRLITQAENPARATDEINALLGDDSPLAEV